PLLPSPALLRPPVSLYGPLLVRLSPFFFSMLPPPPRSTLFPYTTLFRSILQCCLVLSRRELAGRLHRREEAVLRLQPAAGGRRVDRKSTRLNSSHVESSYAVFCLKKKKR